MFYYFCHPNNVFLSHIDCNTALGMSSKTIKDNYINASTALANNPASDARLNTGSYNNNSWCASRIDTSQYLEVCVILV